MGDYLPTTPLPLTTEMTPAPKIGSNRPGPHPAAGKRPVDLPEWRVPTETGYVVGSNLVGEQSSKKTPFKVIVVGAGAAGIDFLHHSLTAFKGLNVDVRCFDKNADVGGTWYENRYPGCACDGPSPSYQFAWRPNPEWSKYYSESPEIWEYMKGIVLDEGLDRFIQLNTEVKKAIWDEKKSVWTVVLASTDGSKQWEEECNVFLNGTGFVNAWKWPDIPGLQSFKGRIFHTANYQEGYDLKEKRVAVIGSGSSGVQTVASIYDDVSKLYTWVRSPTWITAGFAQKYAGKNGANFSYTEDDKKKWREDPEKYREYRKLIEEEINQRFKVIIRNTAESQEANEFSYNDMTTKLNNDARLVDKIVPKNFNVGCRRPTPGNGYLEALVGDKTTTFTETIHSITPNGFKDQAGNEYECDVIITATGFDTSYRPRFPVIGLDGVVLADRWAELPESYMGVAAPNMPNYFMFTGPFTPVAQGAILPIITHMTNYFIQLIRKMCEQHIRRVTPKDAIISQFMEHCRAYLRRTCWVDPCTSWFKQGKPDGPLVMWPGSRLAFFEAVKSPNLEDYDIEYWSSNRFGYLGAGFAWYEFREDGDTTPYLDGDFVPALPRKQVQELIEKSRVKKMPNGKL
ncbi:hypothetical protein BHE90_010446 [Fusarium euwallaceae]|uniref:FAD/NAD(P)-binding domain-containing protein n=1 Tax=Fusarium euwallaceae TaxID=1147111 RepID=A0A430LHB6_9HYPO|nr:hypothetical protein BHE90_010446 [Fusarium euwallaceae]